MSLNAFMLFEGGFASAAEQTVTTTATSTPAALQYPVELDVTKELSLTCDTATSTMLPSIAGLTGGAATSSRDCVVRTNSIDGYSLTAHASSSPAMVHNSSSTVNFTDFTGYQTWTSSTSTGSFFGFNSSGTDAHSNFSGSKYTGFNGTSTITIASRAMQTSYTGITSTMNFRAEVGSQVSQPSGRYTANVTITATMN